MGVPDPLSSPPPPGLCALVLMLLGVPGRPDGPPSLCDPRVMERFILEARDAERGLVRGGGDVGGTGTRGGGATVTPWGVGTQGGETGTPSGAWGHWGRGTRTPWGGAW